MHALIVIAKAPRPGFAKTRLIGAGGVTADVAARLAEAFLRDTVRACERVAGVERVLCHEPADAEPFFRALAPGWRFVAQVGGDLGARLQAALDDAFASGATRVVLIGMDTPHVSPRWIADALRELDRADCVFGPAADGGFYLVALRARQPGLFRGSAWSAPRVLEQSLERARSLGLSVARVETTFDVDLPADLERLARSLGPDGEPCPHTARALAAARSGAERSDSALGLDR